MSNTLRVWVACVLVAAATVLVGPAPSRSVGVEDLIGAAATRPNIVLVLTDDMRADELQYLPHVQRLLVARGVTYTHAISPHPLCCPARASLATGQYGQNNGVRSNEGPWGGYDALRQPGNTIARWLQDAGYRTGFHGKYLNGYHAHRPRPPGWDVWQPQISAMYAYGTRPTRFRGGIVFRDTYIADAVQQLTRRSIRGALRTDKPFFEWINHTAPHPFTAPGVGRQQHPVYEPRYADAFGDVLPPVIRYGEFSGSEESKQFLIEHARARLRALQSVDNAVARIVRQLRRAGALDETYFVFTSDNGYQLGEQGILGKNQLYEGSLRVPLVIRGPGIEPGTQKHSPVSLIDLVANMLRWARAKPGRRIDGLPLAAVRARRDTLLIQTGDQLQDASPGWQSRGVRTDNYVYAAPVGLPLEGFLYDLKADPRQLNNLIDDPTYLPIRTELIRRTKALSGCSGAACNQIFGSLP